MDLLTACCGLDCAQCDARRATLHDDPALREKTAKLWSELNHVEISPEMIRCMGCRTEGIKTLFCSDLCPIRTCATGKSFATCGDCPEVWTCPTVATVLSGNSGARERLKAAARTLTESG